MITESPEYDENEIRIRTQSSNNVKLSKKEVSSGDDDDHVTEVCLHFIICLFTYTICVCFHEFFFAFRRQILSSQKLDMFLEDCQ